MRRALRVMTVIAAGCQSPASLLDASTSDGVTPDVTAAPDAVVDAASVVPVERTRIGAPAWEPVGVVHFAGAIGSEASGYAEFDETLMRLVRPGHRLIPSMNIIGTAMPHPPPYDDELRENIAREGLTSRAGFSAGEFGAPGGVVLAMVVRPTADAPTGSSPDFADGPILPNALFPLAINADLLREGRVYDPDFDSGFPAVRGREGWSHVLLVFGGSSAFGPAGVPVTGRYEWRVTLLDASRAGWRVTLPFVVE